MRFGQPKQLIEVAGRPLVAWSLALFDALPEIEDLVIATEPEHIPAMEALARGHAPRLATRIVPGGVTRQGSTRNALHAVPKECDAVFIHDGARPLVTAADIRAGMAAVAPGRGAVLATPVVDTIKLVPRGAHTVERTLDRSELWAAQTPQFAMLADLRRAHEAAERDGVEATDDVALMERIDLTVVVVPAGAENFKVTRPSDRDLAETILLERAALGKS